jgi:hypothetical protein
MLIHLIHFVLAHHHHVQLHRPLRAAEILQNLVTGSYICPETPPPHSHPVVQIPICYHE